MEGDVWGGRPLRKKDSEVGRLEGGSSLKQEDSGVGGL